MDSNKWALTLPTSTCNPVVIPPDQVAVMRKLNLQIEVIASRLETFSSEKLEPNQFAEKYDLQQRLKTAENELLRFRTFYDVEFCEMWVKLAKKVHRNAKRIVLQKIKSLFEVLVVPRSLTIAGLCASLGINLSLTLGSGFYQISSKETIPSDRRIVLQDRQTGLFLEDLSQVQTIVSIKKLLKPVKKGIMEVNPKVFTKFKVFCESKSIKQLLKENSLFLYQVFPETTSHWHHQLLQAVTDSDQTTVENLPYFFKEAGPNIVNLKGPSLGNGALHLACEIGCFSIVQLLLENGAVPDQRNPRSQTPLYFAAAGQHRKVCQLLIEWGCELYATDLQGQPAKGVNRGLKDYCIECKTFWANAVTFVLQGKTDIMKTIVQEHANGHEVMASLRSRCIDGSSLLHTAAYFGESDVIYALLKLQIDVDLLDYKGATPLQRSRDSNTMQLLLSHGADINWTDADGNTALHMVSYGEPGEKSRLDCLQILLSRKASRGKKNKKRLLPIHCAVMQGRMDVIQALLDFDAQTRNLIIKKTENTKSPSLLYLAVVNSQLECANWLISKSFTFKAREQEELMFNVLLDDFKVEDKVQSLGFLLSNGGNVNAQSENGNSALHLAALQMDLYDILAVLLDCGAEVDIENDECQTPLFFAAFTSNLHGARLLLDHGANVRHQDNGSVTAFGYIRDFDEWLASGLFSEGIAHLLRVYELNQSCSFVRGMTEKLKNMEMSEQFSSMRCHLDWFAWRQPPSGRAWEGSDLNFSELSHKELKPY
ncbi:serine/threonine-protein phosphatase 6 regulatory ankyrin repeat subunit C-like [Ambystoma mexicanum]|uniref:serine/threonine-protein phosphatase 6 regulatory ankyrin repeat subunit C-like n=1 Tax=Ambystoma mexicanum TaxID=8296 RepID=UPI0037E9B8B5